MKVRWVPESFQLVGWLAAEELLEAGTVVVGQLEVLLEKIVVVMAKLVVAELEVVLVAGLVELMKVVEQVAAEATAELGLAVVVVAVAMAMAMVMAAQVVVVVVQAASLHTVPTMGSQLAMVWAKIQARTILTDPHF